MMIVQGCLILNVIINLLSCVLEKMIDYYYYYYVKWVIFVFGCLVIDVKVLSVKLS